jgi:hypothetical protein
MLEVAESLQFVRAGGTVLQMRFDFAGLVFR